MVTFEHPPLDTPEELGPDYVRALGAIEATDERARRGGRPEPDRSRNVEATLQTIGVSRLAFEYRGEPFELLPVSFEDGLRLVRVRQELQELEDVEPTAENVWKFRLTARLIVRLAKRYTRPLKGRPHWLRRNPFRKATEAELGQLLGFFLACRTRSSVGRPAAAG